MLLFPSSACKASGVALLLLLPFATCAGCASPVLFDPVRLALPLPVKALLLDAETSALFCMSAGALLAASTSAVLPVPGALLFPASAAAVAGGCAKLHVKQPNKINVQTCLR